MNIAKRSSFGLPADMLKIFVGGAELSGISSKSRKSYCVGAKVLALVSLWLWLQPAQAGEFDAVKTDKLLEMAKTESKHKRCEKAWKICDELIKRNPKDSQAYIIKADAMDYLQSPEAAIEMLKAYIAKYPADAETYMTLGQLYTDCHQYTKAVETLNQASKLAPKDAEIYHRRSLAWAELKNHQKEIEDLTSFIKYKVQPTRGYQWRADAYRTAGQPDKAIADLNKAISMSPEHHNEFILQRADLYAEIKDYKKALNDYNWFLKKNSMDDAVWFKKGQCCMQLKDYPGAIEAFSQTIDLNESSTAYYARSKAYALVNDVSHSQKDKLAGDKIANKRYFERI